MAKKRKKEEEWTRWRWKSLGVIVYVNWTCTNVIRMALNEIFMCRGLNRARCGGEEGERVGCCRMILPWHGTYTQNWVIIFIFIRCYLLSARLFFMLLSSHSHSHFRRSPTLFSERIFSVCMETQFQIDKYATHGGGGRSESPRLSLSFNHSHVLLIFGVTWHLSEQRWNRTGDETTR